MKTRLAKKIMKCELPADISILRDELKYEAIGKSMKVSPYWTLRWLVYRKTHGLMMHEGIYKAISLTSEISTIVNTSKRKKHENTK